MNNHTLLLVEDSPDDVFFMRYALKKAGLNYPVNVAEDGQQALDYLQGVGAYADRESFPLPTVIFLDLKLPCVSGFEVLAWLRQQPTLSQLPVFILTGSSEERDRERAHQLGAKEYLVKPPEAATLQRTLLALDHEAALPAVLDPAAPSRADQATLG